MHPKLVAYNYFANYFGWPVLGTLQEVVNNPYTERRPTIMSQAFLVNDLSLIGTVYELQKEKYCVKIVNGAATEFYVFQPEGIDKGNITYVSYHVSTQNPIEYYTQDIHKETKYDFETEELKQINYFSKYDNLPEVIKLAVKDFNYKKYIALYAEKPYGTIVECAYNR
jgi:hypothetical protein